MLIDMIFDKDHKIKFMSDVLANFSKIQNPRDVEGLFMEDFLQEKNLQQSIPDFVQQNNQVLTGKTMTNLGGHYFSTGFQAMLSTKIPIFSQRGKIIGVKLHSHVLDLSCPQMIYQIVHNPYVETTKQCRKNLIKYFQTSWTLLLNSDQKCNLLTLTKREKETLHWLSMGKTTPEIAIILNRSLRTVEKFVSSLKIKFQCDTLFELGLKFRNYSH